MSLKRANDFTFFKYRKQYEWCSLLLFFLRSRENEKYKNYEQILKYCARLAGFVNNVNVKFRSPLNVKYFQRYSLLSRNNSSLTLKRQRTTLFVLTTNSIKEISIMQYRNEAFSFLSQRKDLLIVATSLKETQKKNRGLYSFAYCSFTAFLLPFTFNECPLRISAHIYY